MPQAYTPGLRVTSHTTIRKQRRLPLEGDVLVSVGDRVTRDQVVARTDLPGAVTTLNLVNKLGCTPSELPELMLKHEGDKIEVDEPIAENKPLIKWFKTTVASPITGTIESVSTVTGQILLREPPNPVEVDAYIDGRVVDVIEGQGVDLETEGAYIQGIFGLGGEFSGPLTFLSKGESDAPSREDFTADLSGKVVVTTGHLTSDTVAAARSAGVSALVAGCIGDSDL